MKIRMKVGLSGPAMSLAPGDTKVFANEGEARRLIDADFAELVPEEVLVQPTVAVAPAAPNATARAAAAKPAKAKG